MVLRRGDAHDQGSQWVVVASRPSIEWSEPTLPKPHTKRQSADVKARILHASVNAFATHGFQGARLRSIAAESGITIQLLMYHYKTKEQLWEATMVHLMSPYAAARSTHTSPQSSATDRLRIAIADIVKFAAEEPELHRIMASEGGQLTPRLVWLCENVVRQNFDEFCALVVAAQKEGSVPPCDPAVLRYAVISIASVPPAVSSEVRYLTGQNPSTLGWMKKTVELIESLVFRPAG